MPRDGLYAWRVVVLCALLNRTGRAQVRPMFERLFELYPTPERMAKSGAPLDRLLKPLGFGERRAALLRRLCRDWIGGLPPQSCHGVGRYALDAVAIFVNGRDDLRPSDRFLGRYVKWRRKQRQTFLSTPRQRYSKLQAT